MMHGVAYKPDNVDGNAGREESSPVSQGSCQHRGVCTISAQDVVTIFVARQSRIPRDGLATRLAEEFGVTAKAVRDIWTLRTWVPVTEQHWSAADYAQFLCKRLCPGCRNCGFTSIQQACATCRDKNTKLHVATRQAITKHKQHYDAPVVIVTTLRGAQATHVGESHARVAHHDMHAAGEENHHQHNHHEPEQEHNLEAVAHHPHAKDCLDTHFNLLPYAAPHNRADNTAANPIAPAEPSMPLLEVNCDAPHLRRQQSEGEWMFDIALVALDFEEIFDEWQTIVEALRAEQMLSSS